MPGRCASYDVLIMQLPPDIRNAIETLAEQAGIKALRAAAQAVSERYRDPDAVNVAIRSETEALAYLATRFPATYAAARFAFTQTGLAHPEFQPQSLVDLGAGPGTAALAALTQWPVAGEIFLLEPNPHLRVAGQKLFALLGHVGRVRWIEGNVLNESIPHGDLVVSGYVFNEVLRQTKDSQRVVKKVWDAAGGMLVLIEPGTPAGFAHIMTFRDFAIRNAAHIVAPCPHAMECPLRGSPAWCHFSVRVERSRLHRGVKPDAVLGYEDEKFSFVSVAREAAPARPDFRLTGHPSRQKMLQIQVCSADGTVGTRSLAKSHPLYKQIRKLDWGEGIEGKMG